MLVSKIGRKDKPLTFLEKIFKGPIADKFFLLASILGSFGTLYYGLTIWLARSGVTEMNLDYSPLRDTHSFIQIFYIFGVIISGFLIQAGPRLFSLQVPSSKALTSLVFLSYLVSAILFISDPSNYLSRILLSLSALVTLSSVLKQLSKSMSAKIQGLFFSYSLLSLAIGPWMTIQNPLTALWVFWNIVVITIFGASQLFIGNLLGGRRLRSYENIILLILCLITSAMLVMGEHLSVDLVSYAGVIMGISLCYFFICTRCYSVLRTHFLHPIGLSVIFGFAWSLSGAIRIIIDPFSSDQTLHLLALGWGFPIIFAVTIHITGFFSGKTSIPIFYQTFLLIIWQIVPFSRGFEPFSHAKGWVVLVSAVSLLVYLSWLYALAKAEYRIILRQWQLKVGEQMVTEA